MELVGVGLQHERNVVRLGGAADEQREGRLRIRIDQTFGQIELEDFPEQASVLVDVHAAQQQVIDAVDAKAAYHAFVGHDAGIDRPERVADLLLFSVELHGVTAGQNELESTTTFRIDTRGNSFNRQTKLLDLAFKGSQGLVVVDLEGEVIQASGIRLAQHHAMVIMLVPCLEISHAVCIGHDLEQAHVVAVMPASGFHVKNTNTNLAEPQNTS